MPSKVDKYYKEVKKSNPEYSDSQAWATAWSIFCRYAEPGSDHCKKDKNEYFKNKEASTQEVVDSFFVDAGNGGFGLEFVKKVKDGGGPYYSLRYSISHFGIKTNLTFDLSKRALYWLGNKIQMEGLMQQLPAAEVPERSIKLDHTERTVKTAHVMYGDVAIEYAIVKQGNEYYFDSREYTDEVDICTRTAVSKEALAEVTAELNNFIEENQKNEGYRKCASLTGWRVYRRCVMGQQNPLDLSTVSSMVLRVADRYSAQVLDNY